MNGHFLNPNNIMPAIDFHTGCHNLQVHNIKVNLYMVHEIYLGSTPSAFTSAPEKVITTNILSTREFCTCTERIECFVGMLWKLFLMLLALKFLLSHYLECWESPKLAFKWTPGMDARAQWDRCWGPKSSKIETGHLLPPWSSPRCCPCRPQCRPQCLWVR